MKWFFLLMTFPTMVFAQKSAFFESPFYLEDALGNRDTLILGHDIDANAFYNPMFGEFDITLPWDSIFEARAAHFLRWNDSPENVVLSKKIIGSNEGGLHSEFECLFFNEAIILFVRIVHFPLKVSWIRNDFESSFCRNGSTVTPHMLPMVSEYWHEGLQQDTDYACLAERDSFQVTQFVYDFGFYLIDTIQGSFLDTIAAMLFYPKYQNAFESPCTATVSSFDIKGSESSITVYPNPTNDYLTIHEGDGYNWTVFDPISYQVKNGRDSFVDLSNFGCGVYYINIYNEDRREIYTRIFVKID